MSGLSRELDDPSAGWNEAHVPRLRLQPAGKARAEARADAPLVVSRQTSSAAAERIAQLTRTIESEIIPRLLLANGGYRMQACGPMLPRIAGLDLIARLLMNWRWQLYAVV